METEKVEDMCLPLFLVGSIVEIHGQNRTDCCTLSMFQNGGHYPRNTRRRSSSQKHDPL